MKLTFIVSFLLITLFTNAYANNKDLFLLTSHDPHVLEPLKQFTQIEKNYGRIVLVSLTGKLPTKFNKYLKKVGPSDISSYIPERITTFDTDPRVMTAINNVEVDDIKSIVTSMSAFNKRNAGSKDNLKASKWIEAELNKLGFNVEFDCFRTNYCNVYGHKKGISDNTILVEAHLDSVGRAGAGADDNASGVAGLLIMAKEIAKLKTKKSFIFFATNGEEKGLLGAKHYVKVLSRNNQLNKIKFVINMDMIGYNQNGIVDLETNREFENEANLMASLTKTYTSLTPNITIPAWGSDHVPFLKKGIPTVLTIEHWKTKTPCYHSSCDKPGHLNYEYAAEIIKLNLATILYKDENL